MTDKFEIHIIELEKIKGKEQKNEKLNKISQDDKMQQFIIFNSTI